MVNGGKSGGAMHERASITIEWGCWVLLAQQCGRHHGARAAAPPRAPEASRAAGQPAACPSVYWAILYFSSILLRSSASSLSAGRGQGRLG